MALPKIKHSLYKVTIPSTEKIISLRPFTVKEEKILLLVASSKPEEDASQEDRALFVRETMDAIRQIINNCVVDEDFELDKLATFDIEWIFLQMRINSVGNIIEMRLEEDGVLFEGVTNLKDVKISKDDNHTNLIEVTDEVGIVMKYPSFNFDISKYDNNSDLVMDMFKSCIDKVYDNDEVYPLSESTEEDLNAFIESLPSTAFKKITDFFDTMPKIRHEVLLKSEDGTEKKFDLKGISDFF